VKSLARITPGAGVIHPARVMGDVRPGSNEGHARPQGVDVTLQVIQTFDMVSDPVVGQPLARTPQLQKHRAQKQSRVQWLRKPPVRFITGRDVSTCD